MKTRRSLAAGALGLLVWCALEGCQFPEYTAPAVAGDAGQPSAGYAGAGYAGGGASSAGSGEPSGGATSANGGTSEGGSGSGAVNSGGNDTTAGANNGGSANPLPTCGSGKGCAPAVPTGWLGPIALWQDSAGALSKPPACPTGYADPLDLHAKLDAPAASCSCSCQAVNQVCDALATASIYGDLGCQTQCIGADPAASCAPISGCTGSAGTIRAAAPAPSGGSCKPTVTPQKAAATWQTDARLCNATAAEAGVCSGAGELCVPTPPAPFASQTCIYQVVQEGQAAPACPPAYPNSRAPLYSSFADDRGCTPCTCGGPTGGSCSGTLTLSGGNDCSSGFVYTLGAGCQSFSLSAPPSHIQGNYKLKAGSCAITKDTQPTGSAKPNGNSQIVCCR